MKSNNQTQSAIDELSISSRKVNQALIHTMQTEWTRYKFLDMYLYDRLYFAEKPFTTSILRNVRACMEMELYELYKKNNKIDNIRLNTNSNSSNDNIKLGSNNVSRNNNIKNNNSNNNNKLKRKHSTGIYNQKSEFKFGLPYGVHHINPTFLTTQLSIEDSSLRNFIYNNIENLKKLQNTTTNNTSSEHTAITIKEMKNLDPSKILAFTNKLDDETKRIIDQQQIVQHLYECRIASLERYVAFCVMFHAMAKKSSHPWLSPPWDIARSQSNLRVATTGKTLYI